MLYSTITHKTWLHAVIGASLLDDLFGEIVGFFCSFKNQSKLGQKHRQQTKLQKTEVGKACLVKLHILSPDSTETRDPTLIPIVPLLFPHSGLTVYVVLLLYKYFRIYISLLFPSLKLLSLLLVLGLMLALESL